MVVDFKKICYQTTENDSQRIATRRYEPERLVDVGVMKTARTVEPLLDNSKILEIKREQKKDKTEAL